VPPNKKIGNPLLGSLQAGLEHQVRAVNTVRQPGPVKPVERPANRLTVGDDQVEGVQAITMLAVKHPCHHTMHCQRRDRHGSLRDGRANNAIDSPFVVDGIDQYAQHIFLATIDHVVTACRWNEPPGRCQYSNLGLVKISCRFVCRFVPCATGSASAESLCPRRVTNTGKASGTRTDKLFP